MGFSLLLFLFGPSSELFKLYLMSVQNLLHTSKFQCCLARQANSTKWLTNSQYKILYNIWILFKCSQHNHRERFHQQSITLNLRTFYPLVGVLFSGNVTNTLNKHCGESKTRTCNLKAMTLASYQLLHFAVFNAIHTLSHTKYTSYYA